MAAASTPSGGVVAGMSHAGLIAALAYSLFSMTITLTNKALLTSYSFDSTLTLTFLQGLTTVACEGAARPGQRRRTAPACFPSPSSARPRPLLPSARRPRLYEVARLGVVPILQLAHGARRAAAEVGSCQRVASE
jgi:hypothetical protein